jgi:outer membrane protein assembly factor BamD (BamD/ComL family)
MKKILVLLTAILIFSGCTDRKTQKAEAINAAENELMHQDSLPVDVDKAGKLVVLYSEFVNDYPDDSLAPGMLFKEAEILMSINKPEKAVSVIDSLIAGYPDCDLLPQAMHLKGFIYDDKLGSTEMARISFEALIKRFPDHELSKNAEAYLKILGKSPEEIIKEFEKMNTDSLK